MADRSEEGPRVAVLRRVWPGEHKALAVGRRAVVGDALCELALKRARDARLERVLDVCVLLGLSSRGHRQDLLAAWVRQRITLRRIGVVLCRTEVADGLVPAAFDELDGHVW